MNGKKGERRKEELLKIAYRMFIEKGYEQTSIDEIIAEANVAKGTYYYYFPSKEATLEAVIEMMICEEVERANAVLSAPLPVPQKLVAVITTFRPARSETGIADTLKQAENVVMHERIYRRLVDEAVPLLAEVVEEGIEQGIFNCTNIKERVKMLLVMRRQLFDNGGFTERDVEVYVDVVEKTVGAQSGTMGFIRQLIN